VEGAERERENEEKAKFEELDEGEGDESIYMCFFKVIMSDAE